MGCVVVCLAVGTCSAITIAVVSWDCVEDHGPLAIGINTQDMFEIKFSANGEMYDSRRINSTDLLDNCGYFVSRRQISLV